MNGLIRPKLLHRARIFHINHHGILAVGSCDCRKQLFFLLLIGFHRRKLNPELFGDFVKRLHGFTDQLCVFVLLCGNAPPQENLFILHQLAAVLLIGFRENDNFNRSNQILHL